MAAGGAPSLALFAAGVPALEQLRDVLAEVRHAAAAIVEDVQAGRSAKVRAGAPRGAAGCVMSVAARTHTGWRGRRRACARGAEGSEPRGAACRGGVQG